MELPTMTPPPLADDANKMAEKIWDLEYKAYMARSTRLRTNCEKLFSLLLGQCTPAMKAKLESRATWEAMKDDYKVVDLLEAIREVTYKYEGHKNPYLSTHMA